MKGARRIGVPQRGQGSPSRPQAAKERSKVPSVPDTGLIEPSGDIIGLAHKWLPDPGQAQQQRLLARLAERRREILEKSWAAIPEFAAWTRHQATWRSP